jgi:predicted RND superfamily exporter protein
MSSGPLAALLGAVARLAWRRPGLILGVNLVVTVLAALSLHDLRVDATFMSVLDQDEPAAVRLIELSESFGAASGLVLVIEGGEEEERRLAAQQAAAALQVLPEVVSAQALLDLDTLATVGLMNLPDEDFARLESALAGLRPALLRLQEEPRLEVGLDALADQLKAGFERRDQPADPQALGALTRMVEGLAVVAEGGEPELDLIQLDEAQGPGGVPLRRGQLASPDGLVYLVDVRTTLDPLKADLGMAGFAGIEEALTSTRAQHPELFMEFAGLLPGAYQDQQNVLGRVMPLSSVTLLLVLAALLLLDRRWTTPLMVGMGLITSVIWTFALVKLVFGVASLTATAFGILLFGLGVDYAVHVVVRYNDERAAGVEGELAMHRALVLTGRGVVVGALTSMTAFALMGFTDFKAATHLGVTAAMGLGSALILMVVVLPASLRLVDRWGGERRRVQLKLELLDRVVRACLAHPRRVLITAAVLLIAALSQLPRFTLETDLDKLVTRDLPAMAANQRLAGALGGSAEPVLSVRTDLEESRALALRLEALDSVSRVDGAFRMIPPDVPSVLDRNRRLQPLIGDLELAAQPRDEVDVASLSQSLTRLRLLAIRATTEATLGGRPDLAAQARALRTACERALASVQGQGAVLAAHELELIDGLGRGLEELDEASSIWSYGPASLPESLAARYVQGDQLVTYIYPTDYRVDFDFLQRFRAEVLQVDPLATGTLFIVDDLLVGGVDRLPMTLALVILALGTILAVDLRRPRKVLVALVPLVLGSTIAIGIIIALGLPISILMLAAFPVVFGIGIDDGVHILHRYEESLADGGDVAQAIAATGKAILFTSVTTGIGFSILFALNHAGLAGLATLVLIGVGTCFVTSVTLLPVLAQLVGGER